jgi:uroporphyrin-III C-methyltransferase/precorrin-2 dehydrogenase/sirohydrochlorin ferrochelatase
MLGLFPHFPAFMDLAGRPVVLLGGDAALAAVARSLISAGAGVSLFDPAPAPPALELAGPVRIVSRRWRSADLRGAALVIAGAGEPRPQRARNAAKNAHAVFAMLDAPHLSDVAFGAQVARGALSVGVNAAGLPPGIEDAVRERMAAAAPPHFASFLAAAFAARAMVEARLAHADARAQFWKQAAHEAMSAPQANWSAWIEAALARSV